MKEYLMFDGPPNPAAHAKPRKLVAAEADLKELRKTTTGLARSTGS